jgi:predicted RNase H-like HicB family nuclease
MKDTYIFPAYFYYDTDGISIEFPDLPGCLPCADTTENAVKNAKEALGLHLYSMEQDGEPIPQPSSPSSLSPEAGGVIMLVEVFMPAIREKIANRTVKKTLTIPYWLNAQAEHVGVNFSKTLQEALIEKLNLR